MEQTCDPVEMAEALRSISNSCNSSRRLTSYAFTEHDRTNTNLVLLDTYQMLSFPSSLASCHTLAVLPRLLSEFNQVRSPPHGAFRLVVLWFPKDVCSNHGGLAPRTLDQSLVRDLIRVSISGAVETRTTDPIVVVVARIQTKE
jgi:hypothetical protein